MQGPRPTTPFVDRQPNSRDEEQKINRSGLPVAARNSPRTPSSPRRSASDQRLGDALRAHLPIPPERADERDEPEIKQELENIDASRPSQEELDMAWERIVENDEKNSALCNVRSMQENGELPKRKDTYMKQVSAWLNAPDTLRQIARQNYELRHHPLAKSHMLPGDILLRKETPPQSIAHATTLQFQTKPNLNGIEPNRGDHNIFHVAQWIGDPSDVHMDPFLEIAEARGGLGTTNAMRVLAHSIQAGQYWVYRANPEYGLPKDACTLIANRFANNAERGSVGPLLGKAASVVAEEFAANKERYSKTILSTSFRSGNDFSELTDLRKEDAIRLAADPSQMPHTGWTSDSDRFFEVRTQENEAKKEVEGYVPKSVIREGGDTCSSFVVRTNQTAALQIAAAAEAERVLGVNPDAAYPSEPARTRLREAIQPTPEGEVNENLKKKLTDTLTGIGGLLANNAEGIAPKTVEHFCRDEHDFKFVGVLTVAPADVLREEMRFDADGNPIVSSNTSTTGSVGSDKSGCCTVS